MFFNVKLKTILETPAVFETRKNSFKTTDIYNSILSGGLFLHTGFQPGFSTRRALSQPMPILNLAQARAPSRFLPKQKDRAVPFATPQGFDSRCCNWIIYPSFTLQVAKNCSKLLKDASFSLVTV